MEFEEFWAAYPRRIARKAALRAWGMMTEQAKNDAMKALPAHLRYWEACGTSKEFLPYPATWLNGERWADELEMPKATDEWWRSREGIERRAKETGIVAKPGESHADLRARLMERT